MKRILIALCALVFISINADASPLPKKSDRAFVVDMACKEEKVCILSKEAIQFWTTHAADLQKRTGVQVALIVIHGTNDLPFEQYANEAANALRVGTRGNGGVVFLFDNKGRKARLEISRDLEGVIPDATAKQITVLFDETLAQSAKGADGDPLARSLMVVFDKVDHYATEHHVQKGGKAFVAEKDKSFTYFAIICAVIILICSFIAVLWYSKRWYYTKGSVLGGALCVVALLFFSTLTVSLVLTFALAFIVTYLFAWIWHRAGDSAGWDIIDLVPLDGGGNAVGGMAEGVADFAGGGATQILGSAVDGISHAATSVGESCNPGACDLGGCDVSGCDIGGCDL